MYKIVFLFGLMVFTGCMNRPVPDADQGFAGNHELNRDSLAQRVREEYMRSWDGYKTHAMGYDEVLPVSGLPYNWYDESLLITPIDALDGMILLGFREEADALRDSNSAHASWDKNVEVSVFEINIRCLGGLLSSYELTHDERLLYLAEDLGKRLLPAFSSPTGMPYRFVNLSTGHISGAISNPAEIGTLIIEFGILSRHTENPLYYDLAKRAIRELYQRRSDIGLVGDAINVETGEWTSTSSHVGACIDSYYEYLCKGWLLFGDTDLKTMWDSHIKAVNTYCALENARGYWYGRVSMNTGGSIIPQYGALEAFFPAALALSGDVERASRLHASWFNVWTIHGLEPEAFNFETWEVMPGGEMYYLRPEIIESCYYLYHHTRDDQYVDMAARIFGDLQTYCRTDIGYTVVKNVITMEKADRMESFLFGETLKYLYLIFAAEETLDFEQVIFTTEAHPMKRRLM
jgi:mannosidase alpha-like ER degradation enhancer 2